MKEKFIIIVNSIAHVIYTANKYEAIKLAHELYA